MAYAPQVAIRDLASVAQLVQSQVSAGMEEADIVQAKFNSMCKKLNLLPALSTDQVMELTRASNGGPWDNIQKLELARLIDAKSELASMGDDAASLRSKKQTANQKCVDFENFIPEDKWIKMKQSQTSTAGRQRCLAEVAHSINLINPDQKTLYRMVAIHASCEKNFDMPQDQVFDSMDKIQGCIKQFKTSSSKSLPYLEIYPRTVHELPEPIKAHAYKTECLPVEVNIKELDTILGNTKMRGRKKEPDWLSQVPEHLKPQVKASLRQQGVDEAHDMCRNSGGRTIESASSDLRGRSRRCAVPAVPTFGKLAPPMPTDAAAKIEQPEPDLEAELDAEYEASQAEIDPIAYRAKIKEEVKKELMEEMKQETKLKVEPPAEQKIITNGGLDEFEEALRKRVSPKEKRKQEAAAKKAAKKKAADEKRAAKEEEKKKAKDAKAAKKTASSSAKKVMKRPAAAVEDVVIPKKILKIDMKDIFKTLRQRRKEMNYKNFTNYASDYGFKRAKSEGAEYEVYRAFGRMQYKKATELWNQTATK